MALSPEPPSSPESGPERATLSRLHKAIFDIALPKTASARSCTVPLASIQTLRKLIDDLLHQKEPQPLDPRVTELASKLDTLADKIDAITDQRRAISPRASYAEAVNATLPSANADSTPQPPPVDPSILSKLPLAHTTTLKHVEHQSRQILIDKVPDRAPSDFTFTQLGTEEAIVRKGNSALEAIPEYMEEIGLGNFIGARILPNGGLLLETEKKDLVRWFLDPRAPTERGDLFAKHFCSDYVVIKDRTYAVVLDFVPIAHVAGDVDEIMKMEEVAEFADKDVHSIVTTHWMKSPEKRTSGQSTAALLVKTYNRESANALILSGTVVRGKRVFAR